VHAEAAAEVAKSHQEAAALRDAQCAGDDGVPSHS